MIGSRKQKSHIAIMKLKEERVLHSIALHGYGVFGFWFLPLDWHCIASIWVPRFGDTPRRDDASLREFVSCTIPTTTCTTFACPLVILATHMATITCKVLCFVQQPSLASLANEVLATSLAWNLQLRNSGFRMVTSASLMPSRYLLHDVRDPHNEGPSRAGNRFQSPIKTSSASASTAGLRMERRSLFSRSALPCRIPTTRDIAYSHDAGRRPTRFTILSPIKRNLASAKSYKVPPSYQAQRAC
jgi:hypothetical protein